MEKLIMLALIQKIITVNKMVLFKSTMVKQLFQCKVKRKEIF